MLDFYNADFLITYSYYDPNLRTQFHTDELFDIDDVTDMEDMCDFIYNSEVLNAFNITSPDQLSYDIITRLENAISSTNFHSAIVKMNQVCDNTGMSIEHGLPLLLSYDYFFLTHNCLRSLKQNNMINVDSCDLDKLLAYIESKQDK